MAYGDSRVRVIKFGRERAGFVVWRVTGVLEVIYTLSVGEAWARRGRGRFIVFGLPRANSKKPSWAYWSISRKVQHSELW